MPQAQGKASQVFNDIGIDACLFLWHSDLYCSNRSLLRNHGLSTIPDLSLSFNPFLVLFLFLAFMLRYITGS